MSSSSDEWDQMLLVMVGWIQVYLKTAAFFCLIIILVVVIAAILDRSLAARHLAVRLERRVRRYFSGHVD